MRRAVPTNAVGLGVVGIPPEWERYRTAFQRLSPRLRIKAIHDPVLVRSQLAAADLEAEAVSGLKSLFQREDVEGVILFGGHWYGHQPLQLACEHQKPCLLATRSFSIDAELRQLARRGAAEGTLLMVELPWRHQPVTSRLRELLLTSLGPPEEIEIRATLPGTTSREERTSSLAELVDWCSFICGASIASVQQTCGPANISRGSQSLACAVHLQPQKSGELATVRIRLEDVDEGAKDGAGEQIFELRCRRGRAAIRRSKLEWCCSEVAGSGGCESLEHDRGPTEVLLDRFCRRVIGGLVPVETLSDFVSLWDTVARED